MGWPQNLVIGLWIVNGTIHLVKNGEPRRNYSFFGELFNIGFAWWVFSQGGFFN